MSKLEEYFEKFNNMEFPYYKLKDESVNKLYNNLKNAKADKPRSNSAIELVTSFHPSIWRCNVYNHKSPLDAWYDLDILYKTIKNRLEYIGEDLKPLDIIKGFSVTRVAPKVSIFRPALAKYLIQKYLNGYNIIFDPCAGFSGRMLGTCSLGKKYIGYDINGITVTESKKLRDRLQLDAELFVKNSLYLKGEFDCLFTCPPYMNKDGEMVENWHQEIEPLSEDEWIDTCIKNYECKEYLFVVGNTTKYKNNIVEILFNKSHFSNKKEYVILIKK